MHCPNKNQKDKNMKKNRGGRPEIVLTDEQIAKVEELSAYLNCEQIADYFGIDRDTFLAIRKRQPEVLRHYKKGKAHKIYKYAQKLEQKATGIDESGDTTAIIFYLKTQAGWSTENKNDNQPDCLTFSDKQTPAEILNIGFNALKEGKIDFTQMQQIGNLAITKMNIENNGSKDDQAVYQQRSREEALEFAAKMKEARENLRLISKSSTKTN